MLFPPKNITQELASGLIRQADLSSINNTLFNISTWVLELFSAKDLIIALDHENKTFCSLASTRPEFTNDIRNLILDLSKSNDVHQAVINEVVTNLRPISYSSYSWPFPSFSFAAKNKELSIPRTYTLFIPFCSDMLVTVTGDQKFTGYIVAMFDDFIEINDKILELIVTLPNLFSEFTAAYFRSTHNANDLATSFAHDLKHFLLVHQQLIEDLEKIQTSEQKNILEKMNRSLTRISHQANSLLLMSKEQKGNLQINPLPISINEIAQEAIQEVEPLIHAAKLNLEVNLSSNIPQCQIDPAIFPSVIHNLLHNAIKYSKPDSKIYLETSANSKNRITLVIADEGIGIPKQEKELVFTKYFRGSNARNINGNGVGLYIVRKIIEAHKGEIIIDQEQQKGTRVIVELPTDHAL